MPNQISRASTGVSSDASRSVHRPGQFMNNRNPEVSSYMNYGSYSGADIKVIVHVPQPIAKMKRLKREIEALERDLEKIQEELAGIESGDITTKTLLEIKKREDEIDKVYKDKEKKEQDLMTLAESPKTKVLGELQTISWSTHREKSPVRPLGSVYPRAYTRGPRSIAGTLVFTVFYKHALHELLESNYKVYNSGTSDYDLQQNTPVLPDQLPPIDISLVFANEYGAMSHMGLYGVEFFQEGGTFSIEDIFSENIIQYVARDMDPITITALAARNGQGPIDPATWTSTASDLADRDGRAHDSMFKNTDHFNTDNRRNPFI
jgi:hypothetical protein